LTEDIRITPGFLTPKVIFADGYCLETCNLCGVVCPSGAITSFRFEAKSQIHMGLAEINTKECLLTLLKECDRCKAVCPYNAVEILPSADNSTAVSVISGEKCVGCGACKIVCPVSCISVN
jgi:ferredoxin